MKGRPPLSEQQKTVRKNEILQKIEPYLKSGLSVGKALREIKIANSEFYKYMDEDELFGEKIQLFKQYTSVLVNSAIVRELHLIVEKQLGNKSKGIQPEKLSFQDLKFLMWYALNNIHSREEYGRKIKHTSIDVEIEIHKVSQLINSATTKSIPGYNSLVEDFE